MSSNIKIRPISIYECNQVAAVHARAFPNRSLTKLGTEAIRRYYVSQMNNTNTCYAFGAIHEGVMIGYIFSGVFTGVLTGFIRRNKWFLICKVLTHPWFIFDPMFRDALKLATQKLIKKPSTPKKPNKEKVFVILAIAVEPAQEKKGVGQQLLDLCEEKAREGGFSRMSLTVNPDNHKAIRFYQKNGWLETPEIINQNLEMIKHLTS